MPKCLQLVIATRPWRGESPIVLKAVWSVDPQASAPSFAEIDEFTWLSRRYWGASRLDEIKNSTQAFLAVRAQQQSAGARQKCPPAPSFSEGTTRCSALHLLQPHVACWPHMLVHAGPPTVLAGQPSLPCRNTLTTCS